MSVTHSQAAEFVESLRTAAMPSDDLVNIYDDVHDPHGWRRARLLRWLTLPRDGGPQVLFVGEAPGRDGAAVTGVPFASVETLTQPGYERLHGLHHGEGFSAIGGGEAARHEKSAMIFWDVVLSEFNNLPLPIVWNVVPFWPIGNRDPNASELAMGSQWVIRIMSMFPEARVIGVGAFARDRLRAAGYLQDWDDWAYHPSRLKTRFTTKVAEIAGTLRG